MPCRDKCSRTTFRQTEASSRTASALRNSVRASSPSYEQNIVPKHQHQRMLLVTSEVLSDTARRPCMDLREWPLDGQSLKQCHQSQLRGWASLRKDILVMVGSCQSRITLTQETEQINCWLTEEANALHKEQRHSRTAVVLLSKTTETAEYLISSRSSMFVSPWRP